MCVKFPSSYFVQETISVGQLGQNMLISLCARPTLRIKHDSIFWQCNLFVCFICFFSLFDKIPR